MVKPTFKGQQPGPFPSQWSPVVDNALAQMGPAWREERRKQVQQFWERFRGELDVAEAYPASQVDLATKMYLPFVGLTGRGFGKIRMVTAIYGFYPSQHLLKQLNFLNFVYQWGTYWNQGRKDREGARQTRFGLLLDYLHLPPDWMESELPYGLLGMDEMLGWSEQVLYRAQHAPPGSNRQAGILPLFYDFDISPQRGQVGVLAHREPAFFQVMLRNRPLKRQDSWLHANDGRQLLLTPEGILPPAHGGRWSLDLDPEVVQINRVAVLRPYSQIPNELYNNGWKPPMDFRNGQPDPNMWYLILSAKLSKQIFKESTDAV